MLRTVERQKFPPSTGGKENVRSSFLESLQTQLSKSSMEYVTMVQQQLATLLISGQAL